MKIRVTGTQEECAQAGRFYNRLGESDEVKYVQISRLYPNRGSDALFRIYIDIEYYNDNQAFANNLLERK